MRGFLLFLSSVALSVCAHAVQPGDKVDNFKLLDHTGKSHELYYLSDMDAVVLMIQGNGCPIARNAIHTFHDLQEKYGPKNVAFLMLNGNLQDTRQSIAKEAEEFGIEAPILVDESQLIIESLGVERTADSFVIDPKTWKVVYRGALDDRLGYETQRQQATENHVADALDAMLAGKEVAVKSVEAKGCLVAVPGLEQRDAHAKISYADEIAPILKDKCVDCHREGGIGPFAMNSYNMIKGFAPMIREVVRTKRMPPWHADPHVGEFANDRSLSIEQKQTLVHWIEAGAPRGEGPDPLAQMSKEFPTWSLGEPDVIVDIPPTDVPATGVVDYKYVNVTSPLDKGVWVRAVQILPGAHEVLHHAIISVSEKGGRGRGASLPGYVPGDAGFEFPEGTGVYIPAGATFQFQLHYTTYGKARTDASKLGLYLHQEKPKYNLETQYIANPFLKIPPNTKEHWEKAAFTFKDDIILYSILPHAHFRGKAADFVAEYPDGRRELLLSVPAYDFNWQTTYFLKEPKTLPAGTKVIQRMAWDNSSQNPANPDPSIQVTWGEQSWEEMLFGALRYRFVDPEKSKGGKGFAADNDFAL
ncbi:redoxin domain-containing protein [Proteobacteria bacterium 005FR1]|nr:redoxin domain-containing protein [Proteobacteria bacterium 005FR1]